ncbi:MAG TPA: glycoside hydrolase family 2 TIM barrel-domain containing protein [Gemmatimonadaceae bacterium]|nr:glycoside hydrolase family 2 TIM barrel-domain containing protein [Gemmatimonadaceae bacterium]
MPKELATNFSSTRIVEEPPKYVPAEDNPLPRAVTRHNFFELLDGEWRFDLDLDDRGIKEGWHLRHDYPRAAIWPGSIEEHMSAAKDEQKEKIEAGRPWQDKVIAWYERDFTLPDRSKFPPKSMFQITFGACGYETRVWLNGQPLATIDGAEVHYGEYTSFSYELPEDHIQEVNRITVRIEDSLDADLPRGKQESHIYKRGGIWYQTYTGAVRSIWLEVIERNRLRTRLGAVATVEDRLVRFNVTTRIHDPGEYTLRLTVYEWHSEKSDPIATSDFPLRLDVGQKHQRVPMEVPGAKLWSPKEPNLYLLVAELIDAEGLSAEVETHFGLRKIEARGCCVYLNNESIYLDGILYQPAEATYEEMRMHLAAMKKLGCNLVRVHIAGIDPRIYNLADEIGLMIWVEVPSPHSSTHQSRGNHHDELMRMLAVVETHPSVCIWSLYNEDWGAQDIATSEETRRYIVDTYHFMRVDFPQFLVVDNDGWHHISWEGRLKSDLLTVHLYTSDIDKWRDLLDRLVRGETENVAAEPLTVGDPFFLRGHVPVVISEWGGFGFPDYGGPAAFEAREQQIAAYKAELRNRSFAGDVYTQATDVEDERNGLIDAATGALRVSPGLLASDATPPTR